MREHLLLEGERGSESRQYDFLQRRKGHERAGAVLLATPGKAEKKPSEFLRKNEYLSHSIWDDLPPVE